MWKIEMRAVLIKNVRSYDSGGLIKSEIVTGDAVLMKAMRRWIEGNLKAQSDIILEIAPLELKQVKGCGTV